MLKVTQLSRIASTPTNQAKASSTVPYFQKIHGNTATGRSLKYMRMTRVYKFERLCYLVKKHLDINQLFFQFGVGVGLGWDWD
jgi:hypothetical protein